MSGKLTHENVQEILAILDQSSFDELSIETPDFKLSLRRSGAAPGIPRPSPTVVPVPFSEPRSKSNSAPLPAGLVDVPAPMLGTFFHAPKPGADPFVTVGAKVAPDTIIGIIEVMKLMNTVPAGVAGEVVEILAPDGKPVEFGQPILRVKPV